ncbi:YhgE/Pip domain-containing protein [Nocardiopsis rhodophaea]|uniref:YhgE/Pip domain-containing protein n=1 Tax=Nocardiopsis rhodophaea TaxID=280238 RepID=A0ABN3Y6C4_9ACTN
MKLPKVRILPALRLGGLSVRSFFRSPLPVAALVALALIPLLYSGLYLWSFWDPFGNMKNLPVALVNEDEPVTVDGEETHAGQDITDELLEGGDLDWRLVDADEAASGVADGRYYVSLTIPEDFSANLASPSEDDDEPVPAMLEAHYNDANSYIVRQLMKSAFKEIQSAAGKNATGEYLDSMFLGFNEIHGKTEEAADGAGQLADGTDDAKDGSGKLYTNLGDAKDGSAQLRRGIGDLYDGSKKLAEGATTASSQVSKKADKLNEAADAWVPVIKEKAPKVKKGADKVKTAADAVSDLAETAASSDAEVPATLPKPGADGLKNPSDFQSYLDANPDLQQNNPELYQLLADGKKFAEGAADAGAGGSNASGGAGGSGDTVLIGKDKLDKLKKEADKVSKEAAEASDAASKASELADDADDKLKEVDDLDKGLAELAKGNRDMRDGLKKAHKGIKDLDDGIGKLHSGAGDLDDGIGKIKDGQHELADGLEDGVESIPTFDDDKRDTNGDMMSKPVRLSSSVANEAPQYGTGFAPFFVALSLWVGAMMTFMVLPAVSKRGLAGTAPSWRVALAGWLPPVAIGIAQVAVMMSTLHLTLGLDAVYWGGVIGLLVLTVASYSAVVQWASVRFGTAGRIVSLILLMLQLTSAGGTYPIETSPGFFQAIAPYLPMSHVVQALRILISGGDMGAVWTACGVLTAYLVGALLLTWLAVSRKRVWTMKDLYPALKV